MTSLEEYKLRRLLAFCYAGNQLYGDDGELQDNVMHPFIDFRRDSVDKIKRKMQERKLSLGDNINTRRYKMQDWKYVTVSTEDDDSVAVLMHPADDAEDIARRAAWGELWDSGPDLADADCWPRSYTVHLKSGAVTVSVDMDYEPQFYVMTQT